MGPVSEAAAELLAALDSVGEGKATADPGATLANLPALVLGPPRLTFETGCPGPTGATFIVYVVVAADEYAMEKLWSLVVDVEERIYSAMTKGVVVQADPGVFPSGTAQLPCYEIQVEVGL